MTERSGRAAFPGKDSVALPAEAKEVTAGLLTTEAAAGGAGPSRTRTPARPGEPVPPGTSPPWRQVSTGASQPGPGAPRLPAWAGAGTAVPGNTGRCPRHSPRPLPGTAGSGLAPPGRRALARGRSSGAARRGDLRVPGDEGGLGFGAGAARGAGRDHHGLLEPQRPESRDSRYSSWAGDLWDENP